MDRAALDVSIRHQISHGGWCPPGREAEDGVIPARYELEETEVERSSYAPDIPRSMRTELNVKRSDGILILTTAVQPYDRGTNWTIKVAAIYRKPILILNPEQKEESYRAIAWLRLNRIEVLNVAGPAESCAPGIYSLTYAFLDSLIIDLKKVYSSGL